MTSAAAHDSRPFEDLLNPNNTASKVWADIANPTEGSISLQSHIGEGRD